MSPLTSLANDLLEKPANLPTASNYTALNGVIYLGIGVLLIVWPGVRQKCPQHQFNRLLGGVD